VREVVARDKDRAKIKRTQGTEVRMLLRKHGIEKVFLGKHM
jgi:hypothetical protein